MSKRLALLIVVLCVTAISCEVGLRGASLCVRYLFERRHASVNRGFVVLVLGESTTAGNTPDTWPSQLEKNINQRYPDRPVQVINKAIPGTTTQTLVGQLEDNIHRFHPNLIVTMMGVNDNYRYDFPDSLFIPNAKTDVFMTARLARLVFQYARIAITRIYDLYVNTDAEVLSNTARRERLTGNYNIALAYQKRIINIDPNNPNSYIAMGWLYGAMGRRGDEDAAMQKAFSFTKLTERQLLYLGYYFRTVGRHEEAKKVYTDAIRLNPSDPITMVDYAEYLLWSEGDRNASDAYYQRARDIDPGVVHGAATERIDETKKNYLLLVSIASRYHIPVVAMQYPLRSADMLRSWLGDSATVVENITNFNNALKTRRYEDLFIDRFGGDFGHASYEGNRLIAENLTETIIRLLY